MSPESTQIFGSLERARLIIYFLVSCCIIMSGQLLAHLCRYSMHQYFNRTASNLQISFCSLALLNTEWVHADGYFNWV